MNEEPPKQTRALFFMFVIIWSLKPQAEGGADKPLDVMNAERFLVADVGEIEEHGHADELVAPMVNDGSATGNDDLGEVVVKGHAGVAEGHGGVAIDDERGQGGDMQQPALAGHVIVAIAATKGDVGHLQLHLLFPVEGGMLAHGRRCQEETAGGASLDVALRESGRIGETATIEDVEGVEIQRLNRQHSIGQFNAIFPFVVVPTLEVLGILIDDVEAEAPSIAVEVQFEVAVLAHQLGRIKRRAERKAKVADTQADCRLPVGFHLGLEVLAVFGALGLDFRPRHIHSRRDSPFRRRPCDIGGVYVALTIVQRQNAISAMKHRLCTDHTWNSEKESCNYPIIPVFHAIP